MLRKRRYTNDFSMQIICKWQNKNSSEPKIVTNRRINTLDVLFTFWLLRLLREYNCNDKFFPAQKLDYDFRGNELPVYLIISSVSDANGD